MTHTLLMHPEGELLAAVRTNYPELRVLRLRDEAEIPDDGPLGLVIGKPSPHPGTRWMERADRASWVHFVSTGFDGLPGSWLAGRTLTTTRGSNAAVVSEYALTAVLAATKRLPELWHVHLRPDLEAEPLGSLEVQTVAILGYGSIGRAIAERLKPFGCRIVVLRRTGPAGEGGGGVEFVRTVGELVARADHLVIAAPLTDETRGLIGRETLAQARSSIHIVNVGRAQILDQEALLEALEAGIVSRATLDVTDPEPLPLDHPLRGHDRVIVSPHIAWSGPQVERNRIAMLVANVGRWLSGKQLDQAVSLEQGY